MGSPPPILVSTISMPDTLILMVLALVVLGPRKLPKIGRQIGKLMYEFRKASNDFKFQMEEELRQSEEAERRQKEEQERQRALAAAPPPPQLEQTTTQAADPASPQEPRASSPTASETPNPYESNDSNLAADVTRPEEAAPSPAAQVASSGAQATAPRILPPSTGEKVAAERPGKAPESVTPEAERSEPAAHHG